MIAAVLFLAAQAATGPAIPGTLTITVTHLRSTRGTIRICMTRDRAHFPNCSRDPAAISKTVTASARSVEIPKVPPGTYAVALFHDENNNRKLDTFVGIPREGFGFSRNPAIRFGAPRFEDVHIRISPGMSHMTIRAQYLL